MGSVYTKKEENLIKTYLIKPEPCPVTKVNVELVRRVNGVNGKFETLYRTMHIVGWMVILDENIEEKDRKSRAFGCFRIAKTLLQTVNFFKSLKSRLKTTGIKDKALLKQIVTNIANMEKRSVYLNKEILPEYFGMTKWTGYLDVLGKEGVTITDDMLRVIPSFVDIEYISKETYDKVTAQCKDYALEYIKHIESVIDVSLYNPAENERVARLKGMAVKHRSDVQKEEQEKREKRESALSKAVADEFTAYAQKLEFTIENGNMNKWITDEQYESLSRKAKRCMGTEYSRDFSIVLVCRKKQGRYGIYFLTRRYTCTQNFSLAGIFASEVVDYDLLDEKGMEYRIVNFTRDKFLD